jgi:glycosyltransferase involved in cell wall biosynthesis
MKILHITSNGDIGGREKMLYSLVSQENSDRDLRTSVYMKYPRGFFFEKIKKEGIVIYTQSGNNVLSNIIDTMRLFDGFDILVFHFVDWPLFVSAVLSGKPRLYRLSGIYLLSKRSIKEILELLLKKLLILKKKQKPDDSVSKDNTIPASKAKRSTLPNIRSLRRVIKKWYFSFFLRIFFHQIIVNSRYTMLCAQKYYGIPPKKIKVIYNGVQLFNEPPMRQDIRKELGLQPNDFVIGTVCRFDVRKRIDRLLSGFSELEKNEKVKLIIVGGGDDDLETYFKRFVNERHLTTRVIFTGLSQDAEALMSAMDLFVLASDNETFGLALVEAMLLEKPSVVFDDSGGPAEIIANNSFGYVIHDPGELKNIVNELYNNSDLKKEKGKKAREYALKNFSLERFQSEFKKVYHSYLV